MWFPGGNWMNPKQWIRWSNFQNIDTKQNIVKDKARNILWYTWYCTKTHAWIRPSNVSLLKSTFCASLAIQCSHVLWSKETKIIMFVSFRASEANVLHGCKQWVRLYQQKSIPNMHIQYWLCDYIVAIAEKRRANFNITWNHIENCWRILNKLGLEFNKLKSRNKLYGWMGPPPLPPIVLDDRGGTSFKGGLEDSFEYLIFLHNCLLCIASFILLPFQNKCYVLKSLLVLGHFSHF